MKQIYLLVVGSRDIIDYSFIKDYLDNFIDQRYSGYQVVIVSGGARGVDSLVERYANEKGYEKVIMPAQWDLYGKSAGYRRNEQMHQFLATKPDRYVIAFWDGVSKGTAHNFELAKRYENPLEIVRLGNVEQTSWFDPVQL